VAGISWKKTTALNPKADKEVVGHFDHRTTSGVVEGINNKLKLIKKLGYGFRNDEKIQVMLQSQEFPCLNYPKMQTRNKKILLCLLLLHYQSFWG